MSLQTPGKPEYYAGSSPTISPTNQKNGVFSLCSGGVPNQGGFQRIPGKTLQDVGSTTGGVLSIAQMGIFIVVQCYTGLLIFQLSELLPVNNNFIFTNEGVQILNNEGIPITIP